MNLQENIGKKTYSLKLDYSTANNDNFRSIQKNLDTLNKLCSCKYSYDITGQHIFHSANHKYVMGNHIPFGPLKINSLPQKDWGGGGKRSPATPNILCILLEVGVDFIGLTVIIVHTPQCHLYAFTVYCPKTTPFIELPHTYH
jgi:hypothetical protein